MTSDFGAIPNLGFTSTEMKGLNKEVSLGEKNPKLLNGRYEKVKKLGSGSFNVVYLARDLLPKAQSRLLS